MVEYARIIPGCVLLCLNVPKSFWMAFVSHSPIAIPFLKEPFNVFLESKNLIFSMVAGSIWFCFFVFRMNIFTSTVSNLLLPLGPKGPGALNLTQLMRYPINTSMMLFYDLFIYFLVVVVFFTFCHFKEINRRLTKAVIL